LGWQVNLGWSRVLASRNDWHSGFYDFILSPCLVSFRKKYWKLYIVESDIGCATL
jgi:hypothetical protein